MIYPQFSNHFDRYTVLYCTMRNIREVYTGNIIPCEICGTRRCCIFLIFLCTQNLLPQILLHRYVNLQCLLLQSKDFESFLFYGGAYHHQIFPIHLNLQTTHLSNYQATNCQIFVALMHCFIHKGLQCFNFCFIGTYIKFCYYHRTSQKNHEQITSTICIELIQSNKYEQVET